MSPTTRRRFLKTALAGSGALLAAPPLGLGKDAARARRASDIVTLGSTGVKASYLALGTGFVGRRRSSALTERGQTEFTRLVHHGLERGVQFMDLADLYGSHPFMKEALKGVDRDRYVLLSKIWVRQEDWVTPSGGAREEIDRFRNELGEDMIDLCLIHCVLNANWIEQYKRVRDELSELKDRGVVRGVGVSCHDFGALKVAAEHPWVEVIFARINHMGGGRYFMDAERDEVAAVLRKARANGKAVVGMKIFGAGRLTAPEDRDASLKYVIGSDLVDAMTIGMMKPEEIDDSVERIGAAFRG